MASTGRYHPWSLQPFPQWPLGRLVLGSLGIHGYMGREMVRWGQAPGPLHSCPIIPFRGFSSMQSLCWTVGSWPACIGSRWYRDVSDLLDWLQPDAASRPLPTLASSPSTGQPIDHSYHCRRQKRRHTMWVSWLTRFDEVSQETMSGPQSIWTKLDKGYSLSLSPG